MNDFIPYGRHLIDSEDIQAVVETMHSDWLTTGPRIELFENAFASFVSSKHAVALSSGTAALHAMMFAIGVGANDEVILSPMTFAASANAILYQKATPVFCDVEKDTLLIDPNRIEKKITPRTKALLAVDYAGQPCDYEALAEIARRHDLFLLADSCHSLGAEYKGRKIGEIADLTAFSFHPVKNITTGEGGMVTTGHGEFAGRIRSFRNHGIKTDHKQRFEQGTWFYEMVDLGFNYRLTDIQSALGMSQLSKLPGWLEKRRSIARTYKESFSDLEAVEPLVSHPDRNHTYHLYVIRLDLELLQAGRKEIFTALRNEKLGVNVHYIPVHFHPYYREKFGLGPGLCPVAESAYERIITLPLHHGMDERQVEQVIAAVRKVIRRYSK